MKRRERPSLIIFRIGSIGDTVVALPGLHAIARHFPDHRRVLLTEKPASARASSAESVLEGSGLIDSAVYFPSGLGKLRAAATLAWRLRATGARTLIYLAPRTSMRQVRRDLLYFRVAGIHQVLGAPRNDADLRRQSNPDGTIEPEAVYLARSLARVVPVDLDPASWDLRLTADEIMTAGTCLSSLPSGALRIALCPGAKWQSKDWGEARWTALVQRLSQSLPQAALVFLGASDEHALVSRIARTWSGDSLNLCGRLTPRESAAVLAQCAMLVCHDSGPMHLASTQGTPCVALFGNQNQPRQWYPWGDEHLVIQNPRGIGAINVEEVQAAVQQMAGRTDRGTLVTRIRHLQLVR